MRFVRSDHREVGTGSWRLVSRRRLCTIKYARCGDDETVKDVIARLASVKLGAVDETRCETFA